MEQLLQHTPPDCGIAYVIIQHLDPTRKGLMPELLQKSTRMEVTQVKDGTLILPNRVYIIPPNKDMSILHGKLHLLEPSAPRGLRLPIDFFLRSLAQDQRERSIGVILSGMGSDGTLGLRAIKEEGGLVLVQDPGDAKCDSMPRSAIKAGLADIVAPVGDITEKILAWLSRKPLDAHNKDELQEKAQSALAKAVILLRSHTGHDFSHYKRNTLYRRIDRRMGIHQIQKIADYIRYLQENPQELDLLFKELLIGVTNFFRDPAAWNHLRKVVIPELLADRSPGQALRVWVPGCSTGEEAYSLAMAFKESADDSSSKEHFAMQVFATDLDRDAIAKARNGIFPENIAADVSAERLTRFFIKKKDGYKIRNEIREMVVFAPQSIIMDAPFTKLDILSCRNLLIYLDPEVQRKLIPLFHYSLNPGGILFLGSAETVGNFTDLFDPIDGNSRLFKRLEPTTRTQPLEFPASFSTHGSSAEARRREPKPPLNLQTLADQLILQKHAPPAVIVNEEGDILYISGRTGKFLEPSAGKANWNLFVMARENLRNDLFSAFRRALRQNERISLRGLKLESDGENLAVDITVERLHKETGELRDLMLIVFTGTALPKVLKNRGRAAKSPSADTPQLAALQRELNDAREDARLTREGMQTTQEELRSTNEEMQSTNEELQSTNEELMTSKEEMQSLNEELQTVNAELQTKLDELSRSNDDMENLLNSTDIATVFLDNDLNVRRFTERATEIIQLIPGDVGRPFTDLSSRLFYPDLVKDADKVLRKMIPVEKQISARQQGWFTVRIMPYRTLDNRIDGVVITLIDITAAKKLEGQLRDETTDPKPTVPGKGKSTKGSHGG